MISACSPFLPKEHLPVYLADSSSSFRLHRCHFPLEGIPNPRSEFVTLCGCLPGTLYLLYHGMQNHPLLIAWLLLCIAHQALGTNWAVHLLLLHTCMPSRWPRMGPVDH